MDSIYVCICIYIHIYVYIYYCCEPCMCMHMCDDLGSASPLLLSGCRLSGSLPLSLMSEWSEPADAVSDSQSRSRSRSRRRQDAPSVPVPAVPTEKSSLQKGMTVIKLPAGGLCLQSRRIRDHLEHAALAAAHVAAAVGGLAAKPSRQLPHQGFEVVRLPSGGLCLAASGPSSGSAKGTEGKGKGKYPGWPLCELEGVMDKLDTVNINSI